MLDPEKGILWSQNNQDVKGPRILGDRGTWGLQKACQACCPNGFLWDS